MSTSHPHPSHGDMAPTMLAAIIEGVEDPEQLGVLGRLGCHRAQGYFVSRPLTPEAFADFLAQSPGTAERYTAEAVYARP